MADYPALPLWTDRYLADTRHLDAQRHGAYLLLLMEAWRRPNCTLPNNEIMLAKLAACTPEQWAEIRDDVMAFWTLDGRSQEWRQKGLTKERAFVRSKSDKQRDRISKRWKTNKKDDTAVVPQGIPDRYRSDTPTPTPTVSDTSLRSASDGIAAPQNRPPETPEKTPEKSPSAKAELDRITDLCSAAANLGPNPHPNFIIIAPILSWLKAGADLDMDIIPTIRALSARPGVTPRGWNYFSEAVMRSFAIRQQSPPERSKNANNKTNGGRGVLGVIEELEREMKNGQPDSHQEPGQASGVSLPRIADQREH